MRKILKRTFSVVLIILIIIGVSAYRRHTHFSTNRFSGYETCSRLSPKVNSKAEAIKFFTEWLTKETDFSSQNNGIESIENYNGYYEIRLKTAITVRSRPQDGFAYMGYRDYVVTKDGYLRGYYAWK